MNLQYYFSKILKKLKGIALVNSTIHKTSKIEPGSEVYNTNMDRHSFCGYGCVIINADIGSFCSIANDVIIGMGRHPLEWVSTSPVFYRGKDSVKAKFSEFEREKISRTSIGHDVWIGARALIKSGVSIGTGAIIGMGAVVTKNVDPYTVVAGVPAIKIKERFTSDVAERLLASEWWLFDNEKLTDMAIYIQDPLIFLRNLKN